MNVERLTAEGLGLLMLGSTMLLAAGYALQWLLKNSGDRLAAAVWALVTAALLPALALAPFRPMCVWRILPAAEPPRVFERRDIAPSPALAGARPLADVDREPARQPARGAPHAVEPQVATSRFRWWPALLVAYAAGLLFVSGRLALGHVVARRLIKRSSAPPAEVGSVWDALAGADARRVAVRIHPGVGAPRLVGGGRACILVPARLTRPGEVAGLRFALAHELAHYRHGDLPRWRLVNVTCAALWFHPVAWRLRHAVRECQEVLADAAACGEQRVEYAAFLVQAARWLTAEPQAAGLAMARRGASLEPRIRALLAPNLARPLPRLLRVAVLALIGCGLLAFASVRLEAQAVEEQQPPAEPAQEVKPAASESSGPSVFELVVVDAETGKPLTNASAGVPRKHKGLVLWPGIEESTRRHADAQGRIPFADRPQVGSVILIEAPGYTPESQGFLPKQIESSARIPMYHAVEVTGTIKGTKGPVADAKVVAVGGGLELGPAFHIEQATTDASGRFKVALPRGLPGMMTIRAPGQHRVERHFETPPTDMGEISFGDGVWVEGRVLTTGGQPALAHVGVRAIVGEITRYPWSDLVDNSPLSISVPTDDQGNYRLGPLPPGRYFISASLLDPSRGFSRESVIEVGDAPISKNIHLSRVSRVSFHVQRPGGGPVREVSCILSATEGHTQQILPQPDGALTALLRATCPSVWLRLDFGKTDLKPGDTIQFQFKRDDEVVQESSHVLAGRTLDLQFELPRNQAKARLE